LSVSNLVGTLFLGVFLGIIIFNGLVETYLIPYNYQFVIENLFIFVYRVLFEQAGKNGIIYFPFIFSLFSFILIFNLIGVLPYGFAITAQLIWVLFFSTSICLGIFLIGIFNYKLNFLKLFVPKVPFLLYPLMIVLEIVSYIIRSISLGIRLSANILAGHILVHIIGTAVFTLCTYKEYLLLLFPLVLLFLILILELGVAFLQAYIFILLVSMYLNDAVNFNIH